MQRVDDAVPRPLFRWKIACAYSRFGFIFVVGIDEPCAQMPAGVVGIFLLAGQLPRRRQRRNDEAQPHHRLAMIVEVGGIGEAVAPDVGAVGIFLVGPPVVAFGEVVVLATLAARAVRGRYRDGLLREISVRRSEDARAVGRRNQLVRRSRVCSPWLLQR